MLAATKPIEMIIIMVVCIRIQAQSDMNGESSSRLSFMASQILSGWKTHHMTLIDLRVSMEFHVIPLAIAALPCSSFRSTESTSLHELVTHSRCSARHA